MGASCHFRVTQVSCPVLRSLHLRVGPSDSPAAPDRAGDRRPRSARGDGARRWRLVKLPEVDRSRELPAAAVLAALTFVVFGLLSAGIVTDTFGLDDRALAWVGAGLIGLGSLVLAGWALLLYSGADMPEWSERVGGDLLLTGLGALFVFAGIPTFVAGVI